MSRGLIENPVIAFITVSWNQLAHHHSDSVFLNSSTSCTPASVIEKLVWSYMWYGESTIIAIRTFHAVLRRILYVVAWPITFPPVARKPSLPAEKLFVSLWTWFLITTVMLCTSANLFSL